MPSPVLRPDDLVRVTPEGEAPVVVCWRAFRADNADDETIDWPAMAATIAAGKIWRDGGGAAPTWTVERAP